jgi:K+-sensing histidine kinase KdpD
MVLVVLTLGVIRIAGINPRAYAYVPLMLPVIASSILFGFSYGLLALIAGTLAADYFFALPVYDFSFGELEDTIGLAIFAIFGAAAAWIIDEIREPSS